MTQSCGISIRFLIENIDNVKKIMNENQIEYKGIYKIIKLENGKKQVEQIC
ncbi:MAG: putative Se/S carrier-like protein [Intestinibacter sp.]